jgi:hypothetical protein
LLAGSLGWFVVGGGWWVLIPLDKIITGKRMMIVMKWRIKQVSNVCVWNIKSANVCEIKIKY